MDSLQRSIADCFSDADLPQLQFPPADPGMEGAELDTLAAYPWAAGAVASAQITGWALNALVRRFGVDWDQASPMNSHVLLIANHVAPIARLHVLSSDASIHALYPRQTKNLWRHLDQQPGGFEEYELLPEQGALATLCLGWRIEQAEITALRLLEPYYESGSIRKYRLLVDLLDRPDSGLSEELVPTRPTMPPEVPGVVLRRGTAQ
jgi:hypothetical protein